MQACMFMMQCCRCERCTAGLALACASLLVLLALTLSLSLTLTPTQRVPDPNLARCALLFVLPVAALNAAGVRLLPVYGTGFPSEARALLTLLVAPLSEEIFF